MTVLSMERTGRITGSRIAGVLGLSPYMNRDEVMRDMVREFFWDPTEFAGNFVTDWGKEHEARAIAEYEMARGVIVVKSGPDQELVIHPTLNFLAYTPDGLVGEDGLNETKAPWRAKYTHINERPDYEMQLRLGMDCTERAWGDFAVWRESGLNISRIERDPGWLGWRWSPISGRYDADGEGKTIRELLEEFIEEFEFTIGHEDLAAPHRAPLVDLRVDDEWRMASLEFLEARATAEAAAGEQEAAKRRLIALSGGKTSKGCGVHVIRGNGGKGSVSYKAVVEKYAPDADLEPFRGAPKPPDWTVRRTPEKKGK